MHVERNDIISFLHDFLSVSSFTDWCVNGLQVEGTRHIQRIATAVSIHRECIERAISVNADMIIVHHGLFWKSDPHPSSITGIIKSRLTPLLVNEINLCAYHLPLDAHPEIGNNILIARLFDSESVTPLDVGFIANLADPIGIDSVMKRVRSDIHLSPRLFSHGSRTIRKIAIMSGSPGNQFLTSAAAMGADVLLTGAIQESTVELSRELGIHVIDAGHYNTEQFGIRALGEVLVQQFGIDHSFLHIPNPV